MKKLAYLAPVLLVACANSASSVRRVTYANGTPHFEYQLRDGLPHGTGRVWHPNGELSSVGEYVNGVKHGEFTFFDESGAFEHKAYFWHNVEVWRGSTLQEHPPTQLIDGLTKYSGAQAPRLGEQVESELTSTPGFKISTEPPAPYFTTLDRTTGLNRVGMQFGFGGGEDVPFGSVLRGELFANYRFSNFGAYGQLSQSYYEATPAMTLAGRRTLEGGGTYQYPVVNVGMLTARAGLLMPIGNDDTDGFIASSAASGQRATDAASAFPSTIAIRTGASLTRMGKRLVLQGDGGVDWLIGGPNATLGALLRLNAGIGYGMRSALVTLEMTNTMRIEEPERRIHAFGVGGVFWVNRMWLSTSVSTTVDGATSLTGALGYEL